MKGKIDMKVYVIKAYHDCSQVFNYDDYGIELIGVVDSKEKALEKIKQCAYDRKKEWEEHDEVNAKIYDKNPWRIELISPDITISFCCEQFELE